MQKQKDKYKYDFEEMVNKMQQDNADKRRLLDDEKHQFNIYKNNCETDLSKMKSDMNNTITE